MVFAPSGVGISIFRFLLHTFDPSGVGINILMFMSQSFDPHLVRE